MFVSLLIIIFSLQKCNNLNKIKSPKNLRKLIDDEDIIIVHVNDVHCGLNDTIGYDGISLFLDELKRNYTNVISVDVGDHIQGGTLGSISDGSAIIKIINRIGFDVAILGNHEFDYGIEQLEKLEKNITSRYICANFCYRENKTTIFEPYKIIEKGGKKIAFIGVLTPLTFSKTYLSSVRDKNGEQIYDFLAGENGKILSNTIQKYIDEVKNEVNYTILLTHIGLRVEAYTSEGLLSNLKNVDAVLDAHTHQKYIVTEKDQDNKDIYITQTGTKLEGVGLLIIKKDGSIISEIIDEIPEPINKTNAKKIHRASKDRWVDEEISNYMDNIWKEYEDILNLQVGHSDFDIIVRNENSGVVECRYKECTLGNLVADSLRYEGNAQLTILTGGSVRNNMNKGNLTRGQLIDILPWFNNLVVKELTGQTILDALEFGVSKLPNVSGGFPQVSGITFIVDTSFDSTVLTDENGMFINVTGKRRVSNVKINGEDLNLTQKYNASLDEFIAKGGDGYSMFDKFDIINESLITDTDAFSLYIEDYLKGEIPEKYKDYQGRINFLNKTSNSFNSSLPNILLIGFDNYTFSENSYIIKFLTHLRINNYTNNDIRNITLKLNIIYFNRLRYLDELDITCNKQTKKESEIFTFNCIEPVKQPVSIVKYINNNIKIDGNEIKNLEMLEIAQLMGENIQNQTGDILSADIFILEDSILIDNDEKIIIEGRNNITDDLTSNNSDLLYVENNKLKNISCIVQKGESENRFKVTCHPKSHEEVDLKLNNMLNLKDVKKNVIISFKEGNSKLNSTKQFFHNFYNRKKNSGLSSGGIVAIIFSILIALSIVVVLILFLKQKSQEIKPNKTNNIPSNPIVDSTASIIKN